MLRRMILVFALTSLLISGGCHTSSESNDHHEEEARNHSHEGFIVIEPERALALGIESKGVKPGDFSEVITTGGKIESAQSDIYTATALSSGILNLLPDILKGKTVTKGELIGRISASGIQGGDVNAAARANLEAAKKELDRLKPLYEKGLVTASAFNEAERIYKESRALAGSVPSGGSSSVISPANGVITGLPVSSGQFVEAGQPIAIVTKNSRMTLRADLPERYYSSIGSIQTARFRPSSSDYVFSLDSLQGSPVSGSLATGEQPGYIPLYFTFNNNGVIAPGSSAEIYLIGHPRRGVISVAKDALIELQGNKYVYVIHDGHAYEKRKIETGGFDGLRFEVTAGLKEGEQIVEKGAMAVRMSEISAIAPPAHTHNH